MAEQPPFRTLNPVQPDFLNYGYNGGHNFFNRTYDYDPGPTAPAPAQQSYNPAPLNWRRPEAGLGADGWDAANDPRLNGSNDLGAPGNDLGLGNLLNGNTGDFDPNYMTPAQRQAHQTDQIQKTAGVLGMMVPGMAPAGMVAGQVGRVQANEAYADMYNNPNNPNYDPDLAAAGIKYGGDIGFVEDVMNPDFIGGSPEDIQSGRRMTDLTTVDNAWNAANPQVTMDPADFGPVNQGSYFNDLARQVTTDPVDPQYALTEEDKVAAPYDYSLGPMGMDLGGSLPQGVTPEQYQANPGLYTPALEAEPAPQTMLDKAWATLAGVMDPSSGGAQPGGSPFTGFLPNGARDVGGYADTIENGNRSGIFGPEAQNFQAKVDKGISFDDIKKAFNKAFSDSGSGYGGNNNGNGSSVGGDDNSRDYGGGNTYSSDF